MMNAYEMAQHLTEVLGELSPIDLGGEPGDRLRALTFEDASLLTRDAGVVLRVGEVEYQLTVVRRTR